MKISTARNGSASSAHAFGRVIVMIQDGELSFLPIAKSDLEAQRLLDELRRLVEIGDFGEALERAA